MNKYVIWHVQGGLGKNVAATSLIPSLKEKYSDQLKDKSKSFDNYLSTINRQIKDIEKFKP